MPRNGLARRIRQLGPVLVQRALHRLRLERCPKVLTTWKSLPSGARTDGQTDSLGISQAGLAAQIIRYTAAFHTVNAGETVSTRKGTILPPAAFALAEIRTTIVHWRLTLLREVGDMKTFEVQFRYQTGKKERWNQPSKWMRRIFRSRGQSHASVS